jgi:hypothetical protein
MSIEFEESGSEFHIKSRKLFGEPETPTMIKLLLKSGWVKNEKQAVYVLLGIIVAASSAAFFVGFGGNGKSNVVTLPDKTQVSIEQYSEGLQSGIYKE